MRKNDYVIIMAGGIGSRFWPLSRTHFPKQFHDILGNGQSLIRATFERFAGFIPDENIYVVTNSQYKDLVQEHLPELATDQILLEPRGRNTAPCVAYASAKIASKNPEASIFVAASDHLITNRDQFLTAASFALDECRKKEIIMTLGINPTRPDTGYGYIQFLEDEKEDRFFKVKTFTEKPDIEVAKSFLLSGDFLWNSGMFIFSAKTIQKAFETYLPEMYELFYSIGKKYYSENESGEIDRAYEACKNISIDYGIMEKAENVFVIKSSFGWSDLGTWGSLYENKEKDYLGNAVEGEVMVYESANNVIKIKDPEKLVVLQGLEGYIVVDTGDVLMICKTENEQKIREIVSDIKNDKSKRKLS